MITKDEQENSLFANINSGNHLISGKIWNEDSFFVFIVILQINMQHVIKEKEMRGHCIGIWEHESHMEYAIAMPI